MTNIGIYGANGRMGRMIELCLGEEKEVKLAMLYDRGGNLDEFGLKISDKNKIFSDFV